MARGKSVTKKLLDSSQAALFAGIEIHNKPNIAYRYQTSVILIINAWELALKAYIYKYIEKKKIYTDKTKEKTITISKAMVLVRDHILSKDKNNNIKSVIENLTLINDYRCSMIHFYNEKLNPSIFMLISKAVLNYDEFLKKYFSRDITKNDNLIILPVGFKLPFDPIYYLKQDFESANNEFINKIIQTIEQLNNDNIQDSIIIGFSVFADRYNKINNADIIASLSRTGNVKLTKSYRITNDPDAPKVRIELDLPPLTFTKLKDKLLARLPNMKMNDQFWNILQEIKNDETLCRTRLLDPEKKTGSKKYFYEEKAVDIIVEKLTKQ